MLHDAFHSGVAAVSRPAQLEVHRFCVVEIQPPHHACAGHQFVRVLDGVVLFAAAEVAVDAAVNRDICCHGSSAVRARAPAASSSASPSTADSTDFWLTTSSVPFAAAASQSPRHARRMLPSSCGAPSLCEFDTKRKARSSPTHGSVRHITLATLNTIERRSPPPAQEHDRDKQLR